MINLKDATFLIPLRIESEDRMRNIITTLVYLLSIFDTTIIIKEFDKASVFNQSVLPQLKEALTKEQIDNIVHVFESSDNYIFHRTKLINDMIMMSSTKVVVNYDTDILLPQKSYVDAVNRILVGDSKVVYPYGYGDYQYQVNANDHIVSEFINSDFDFNILKSVSRKWDAKFGFCQFFDRIEYIKFGMENENFVSYGYEDDERYFRFNKLSKVSRLEEEIFHLEHSRTSNSWFTNPHIENNKKLWETLREYSSEKIIDYYSNQQYLIDRNLV